MSHTDIEQATEKGPSDSFGAVEELELLAKWKGYLEGKAQSWRTSPSTRQHFQPGGRPEYVDENHEELFLAIKAQRALEQLRASSHKGRAQASLLETHFVQQGPEARKRAQRLGELRLAYQGDKKRPPALSGLMREQLKRAIEKKLQEALAAYQAFRSIE